MKFGDTTSGERWLGNQDLQQLAGSAHLDLDRLVSEIVDWVHAPTDPHRAQQTGQALNRLYDQAVTTGRTAGARGATVTALIVLVVAILAAIVFTWVAR